MRRSVRLAALLAIIALIPSTSAAPVDPVTALAPVEVWVDGLGDLQGIAVDAEGAVYVADRLAGTVTRIAPDRSRAVVASGLDRPIGLAFDPSGRLVIGEEGANRVVRIESDGTHTAILANVQRPRWLALGPDGVLYVSARASTSGDTEASAGALESQVILRQSSAGAPTVLADGFVGLQGLAVHDNVVYAAATGRSDSSSPGGVYAITVPADGSAAGVALVGTPGRGQRAVGLAIDSRLAIFATTREPMTATAVSPRGILKLRTDGTAARFTAGLADPEGLAFDADGHLFVADGSAGRVLKFHAPKPPVFGAIPPYTNVSPLSIALTAEPGAAVVVEGASTVAGTADAQGAVDLAAPLTANAPTTLEARAIGRGGDGLVSRAAEATVVHDNVAPALDWPSPVPGGQTGATIAIRLRADDAVSGVASITVTVDGRPVSVTSTPSLPARSVTASATWDGATDGVHTLSVIASDRAGNPAALSHSVVIGTGASPGQPASTLATSTSLSNPADPPGFNLTLAPASASVLQGGTTSYGIEAANGPARLGSARLSVDGLPSGVTASFIPPQLAPGQSAQLLLKATRDAAIGAKAFTVRALGDGGQASSVTGALTVLAGGRTALAGRVVDTDRKSLARVAIILDNVTVSTDANGNFLLLDPPTGEQVVLIDGDPAGSAANKYPTIPVSLTIVANQLNELPYLPHLHRQHERFTPIHPTQKTVATDPDLPGVALHLEGGNDVIGWDGKRAAKVSIRTVPADRLPVRPLPPGLRAASVYMFYFGKRGGGVPQQPVPFEAPNELGLAPGEKAALWYFDESPRKGEAPNDWRIAGTGTVSADGRTITTDAGVGIPKFCCGAALWNPQETGTGQQPGPTSQGGNEVPGADPVDLATGIFTLRKTDLVLPGRIPVAITRTYRSGDTFPNAFGLG
ncbi:MAG TPA: DUF6531 domain-containing protein, partial [Candidatus Acidoferrum sp.]|nr:DUF6531 domain-containing protein [Candidatus Acidoferrum sp.]